MKRIADLINRNLRFFRTKSSSSESPVLPLITLSRERGSGGKIIADKTVKALGGAWKLYHKEIVDELARETNLEKELIREVDEGNIPFIEEMVDDMFGKHYLNLPGYYKHLLRILSTIGQRGYAVIVGRGTNFLFPDSLKIRVICEMKTRIKWLMQFEKISEEEAKKTIKDSDKKRADFVQHLFHHDIRKAHHYDLVIRTSEDLSIDDAVDIIVQLAKRRFNL